MHFEHALLGFNMHFFARTVRVAAKYVMVLRGASYCFGWTFIFASENPQVAKGCKRRRLRAGWRWRCKELLRVVANALFGVLRCRGSC